MKTKLLCLLLVMIMVVSMLASCFGGGSTEGEGEEDGTSENEGNKKPGGSGNNNQDTGITYPTDWSKTTIKVKLTNHSNSSELTSGCKRYYAGADTAAFQEIDTNIRTRNQLATSKANVTTDWSWIEDSEAKGWGANINDMVKDTTSGSSSGPDIYCNFAYDMTCAALRGCFSNLLATDYANGNHFRFVDEDYNPSISEEDYFNSKAGEGYFYQYMESLSLTPKTQIYCLASNYTIDVMRAFLVVPVNVTLMNQIKVTESAAGDRDNDKDHDIEDFYALVWDNYSWDYTALAKYSNAIFQTGGTGPATTDIGDNRVGFAIGKGSGLSSSGILYTTSVKILEKNNDGSFSYPKTNPDLDAFATALNNLFVDNASKGICVVTGEEGKAVVPEAVSELDAIRIRFSKDNVLFGGIIMVGSLEDKVYQDMKAKGGFGVVPVPLYRSHKESGDEYKTLVHNIARIMAISKATNKFAQCSAWLDYQSRSSELILEDYYTQQLTATVGGVAGDQNKEMLTYIRNHVNNCFDKTYEDAIANYMKETDPDATATRWHGMLMNNNYKYPSFAIVYESVLLKKQDYIQQVYTAWLTLDK